MTVDGWEKVDHDQEEKVVANGYLRRGRISQVWSLSPVPGTDRMMEITITMVVTVTKWSSRGYNKK